MITFFKKQLTGAGLLLLISPIVFAQSQLVLQPDAAAGKDTYIVHQDVNDTYGNTNYGTDIYLKAERWTINGNWNSQRSFLAFDLSSIPSNAIVYSATLTLYGAGHCNTCNSNSTTNAGQLVRTGSWNENTVTWNTQPPSMLVSPISLPASTSATQDYTIDVLSHVKDMVANPSSNYGWRLELQNEGLTPSKYKALVFYSSDASDPTKRPKLTVNYSLPATSYVPGFQGGSGPPSLRTTLEAGTTPVNFAISQTGAATYSIPLTVAPGLRGLTPNLSISYNSQAGDGMLGLGWNLSGLSSISRTVQSYYYNSQSAPVTLTNSDNFVMDGNHLIPATGSNGGVGTVYGTEKESFVQVISYGTAGNGPAYFRVCTKNGDTLYYGKTEDSRIEASGSSTALTWLLNRVADNRGNYMDIHYYENNSTGEFYPDRIDYTGSNSFSPYNRVKFNYSARIDDQLGYVKGSQVRNTVLLTDIQMFANNNYATPVHEYGFGYSYNVYSMLSEIDEKGTDGKMYNPITIDWQKNNLDFTFNPAWVAHIDGEIVTGDFNADGFTDIVSVQSASATWYLYLNNGSNQFVYTSTGPMPDGYNNLLAIYIMGVPNNIKSITDFDGDGKEDIVVSMGGEERYIVLLSYGTGFSISSTYNFYTYYDNGDHDATHDGRKEVLGDFDGDGKTDLFVYYYDKDYYYYYSSSRGVSFPVIQFTDMGDHTIELSTVDYDGDGKQEILIRTWDFTNNKPVQLVEELANNGVMTPKLMDNYPARSGVVHFGDFNGDGKTDMLIFHLTGVGAAGNWQILLGQQTTPYNVAKYVPTENIPNCNLLVNSFFPTPIGNDEIFVADFNGDGKSDIVDKQYQSGVGTTFKVLFSTGNSFIQEQYSTPYLFSLQQTSHIGDYNGDGVNDLLYADGGTANLYFISFNDSKILVKQLFDGLNKHSAVTYNTLPKMFLAGQYSKDAGQPAFPVINFQGGMSVVSQSAVDNGIGGMNPTQYTYSGAELHLQGKGFLGFTKVTSYDAGTSATTVNTYSLPDNAHFFQRTLSSTQTSSSVSPYTALSLKTFSTYTFVTGAGLPMTDISAPPKRYYVYAKTFNENDQLHGNVVTTYTVTQDKWGNTTDQASSNSAVTSSVHNTFELKGAWIPSCIKSYTTTIKRSSDLGSYIRSGSFVNNNFGQPLTKTEDVGLLTTYTYDDVSTTLNPTPKKLGNLIKTQFTGNGITSTRSVDLQYEPYGRFVIKEVKAIGQPCEQSLLTPDHDAYGNVLTETDANNLTTYHTYDGFGRLITTTTPTGKISTTTRILDYSIPGCVFKQQTTLPGTPTSTEYFDNLGRSILAQTTGFDGTPVSVKKAYNSQGQLASVSEPYTGSAPSAFTSYAYNDAAHRVSNITLPTGTHTDYSYSGNTTTAITTQPSAQGQVTKTNTKTLDASGALISSSDNGGTITYSYFSCGKPQTITPPGGAGHAATMTCDHYGRQTSLFDWDAGVISYDYNALGELIHQQDENQLVANSSYSYTLTYDALGRVTKKSSPQEGDLLYTYDTQAHGKGMLSSVTGLGISYNYTYDTQARLASKTENIGGVAYTHNYEYDDWNRIKKETYPGSSTRFAITRGYNANGYPDSIKNASNNSVIWKCNSMNERGQVTSATCGNQLVQIKTYSALGFLQSALASNRHGATLWKMDYTFDETTGNLFYRDDALKGQSEVFQYDVLDRLTNVYLNGSSSPMLSLEYPSSGIGNIDSKSDATGAFYDYWALQPHAVTRINSPRNFPTVNQTTSYTPFNRTNILAEDPYTLQFSYGPDYERKKSVLTQNTHSGGGNITVRTVIYSGNYEKITKGTLPYNEVYYIHTPDGLALNVRRSGIDSIRYICSDHLGSINCMFDQNNNKLYEQNFDAWGRERNPADWSLPPSGGAGGGSPDWLIRGYAGQEHHKEFGLINMNARMYDPLVGRMLSPDIFVQNKTYTQDFNRYSYCSNNPLKYRDMDGNQYGIPDPAQEISQGYAVRQQEFNLMNNDPLGYSMYEYKQHYMESETKGLWAMSSGGSYAEDANYGRYGLGTQVLNTLLSIAPISGPIMGFAGAAANGNYGAAVANLALGAMDIGAVAGFGTAENRTVYRAISTAEMEDIKAFGGFRSTKNSLEGKFFANNYSDASSWGRKMVGEWDKQMSFHIAEVNVPSNYKFDLEWDVLDNRPGGAAYIDYSNLSNFNSSINAINFYSSNMPTYQLPTYNNYSNSINYNYTFPDYSGGFPH